MDTQAFKGLLEHARMERAIRLWTAIVRSLSQDPAYAKRDWNALHTLALRKIRNGTFSED